MTELNKQRIMDEAKATLVDKFVLRANDAMATNDAAIELGEEIGEVPELADDATDEQRAEYDRLVRKHNIAVAAANRSAKRAARSRNAGRGYEELITTFAKVNGLDYDPVFAVEDDETA